MSNTTADFLILTPSVLTKDDMAYPYTAAAPFAVVKTLNLVYLDTQDVYMVLPDDADAGTMVTVSVVGHPSVALTSGVVRVRPNRTGSFDTIDGKDEFVIWELHSNVTFLASSNADPMVWVTTDVL